jgi:hypothetical protein
MTKGAVDDFEPSKQDDREIGSFLHEVIQTFMKNHLGQLLDGSEMESYHTEIGNILDKMLEENRIFDTYTKASIRGRYLESLKNVVALLLDPGSKLTLQAVGLSMLSVAGSEAVLLIVLGLPLILLISKTKIKDII